METDRQRETASERLSCTTGGIFLRRDEVIEVTLRLERTRAGQEQENLYETFSGEKGVGNNAGHDRKENIISMQRIIV
jgi:hypothetical protein